MVRSGQRLVISDSRPRRVGYTYNCPVCGESWAILEASERYIILSLPCGNHQHANFLPGSILPPLKWWDYGTLPSTLENLDYYLLVYETGLRL